jgi:hypothetical protein
MHTPDLYEVLYVSTLAPTAALKVVGEIAGIARLQNQKMNITGLLVFDGMRFCQQIEGPRKPVLALLERIRQDWRHVDLKVLHHGALEKRRFRNFSLGYAPVEDVDLLANLEQLDDEPALQQFLALIDNLDMPT